MNWEAMTPDERDWLIHEVVILNRKWTHEPVVCPPYTQSMDAAWLVVRYFATHLYDQPNGWSQADAFYTRVAERINGRPTVSLVTLADLTPERICKAALQAVGVDLK